MNKEQMIEQLGQSGTPLSGRWINGADVQPPDGEPVLVVATGHKGDRYYDVMCYDKGRGQWTSPGGIVVYWHPKMTDHRGASRPAPWWRTLPPMPPAPSPEGQIALIEQGA